MSTLIRLAGEGDAADCLKIYRPFVEETAVSFETDVPSLEAYRERLCSTLERWPWLVCEAGGRVAGFAYASPFRARPAYQWSVEVTVYLAEGQRGRGRGTALYQALLNGLRRQGFLNAYAVITLPNPPSVALHERLGFRFLGVLSGVGFKLGRWHDVGWWHLRLGPLSDRPQPPLPPQEAVIALNGGNLGDPKT